jgi:hypothetical protein
MYMAGTAAFHPLLPPEFQSAPVTSDLTGEELWGMTQLLPAQAIIRDKDTRLSGSGGFDVTSIRAGG